ncbi:NfeD family protein [Actinomadura kijaniata]|uniref:Membrane protein implicated in regulation of membrane protease activity n=1 Tax=Actinomadura namibiensis TaxID=182080 RepID=A0A7W3LM82_ACTNM|nr:NfeD family protein [Actinomadura namibiensis]MBA8950679.1 membrane protein implicated in regulation of membrane protease activity [Actinomadura namibiensis]
MEAWVVWLFVAALLGVAELLTLTLVLGLLAVAALLAGLTGAVGLPLAAQAAVFAIGSVAGLAVVRPVARRHITQPPLLRSGADALVGREAVTLTQVTRDGGRARIGGEEWTVRPYDPDAVIPAGTVTDVLAIEGATALLYAAPHHREAP